jgi:hypothetical protein
MGERTRPLGNPRVRPSLDNRLSLRSVTMKTVRVPRTLWLVVVALVAAGCTSGAVSTTTSTVPTTQPFKQILPKLAPGSPHGFLTGSVAVCAGIVMPGEMARLYVRRQSRVTAAVEVPDGRHYRIELAPGTYRVFSPPAAAPRRSMVVTIEANKTSQATFPNACI